MSRLVEVKPGIAASGVGGGGNNGALKEYGERVAKYVPAEVLAFYTGVVQVILTKEGEAGAGFRLAAFAVFFLVAWVATPLWLGRFAQHPASKRPNQVMGFLAFLIWSYAYPAGVFFELGWHEPVAAALLLLSFSFFSGFYQPKE